LLHTGLAYLLYQLIRYFKSEKVANVVCIIFLLSDIVMVNGAAQCADIPLAMFFLSAIACIFFYFQTKRTALIILGTVLAGLSIWVKNEGMMFFLIYVATLLGYFLYKKDYRVFLKIAICSIPIVICSCLYKKLTGTQNDLVQGLVIGKTYKFAFEANRYFVVISTFISMILKKFLIFFTLVILALKGFKIKSGQKTSYILSTIIFIACVLGYFVVYIVAPHDITWIVENSMERIILQILPVFLFLVAVSFRIGKPDTIN